MHELCESCKHQHDGSCGTCMPSKYEVRGPPSELDKLDANADIIDTLHDFQAFLDDRHISLCNVPESEKDRIEPRLVPIGQSFDSLVYAYLGIDAVKLEAERREVLKKAQKAAAACIAYGPKEG